MVVNVISKQDFLDLVYNSKDKFIEKIAAPEVFVVKDFFKKELIISLRNETFNWGVTTEPGWHPLYDDCPDYHRLHDNYEKAHVKQKFHGFYHHGWYDADKSLIDHFIEIYHLKNFLSGVDKNKFITNKPSDGVIARLNFHHYPIGGGYQSEHIDPANDHAKIQTIIAASKIGADYTSGGVFARKGPGEEKFYLDKYADIGDMIVMSPNIPHGVDPIDADKNYSWQTNDGRWIILPLFVYSDYPHPENIKPTQLVK